MQLNTLIALQKRGLLHTNLLYKLPYTYILKNVKGVSCGWWFYYYVLEKMYNYFFITIFLISINEILHNE